MGLLTKEEFLAFIKEDDEGCWIWQGSIDTTTGYGKIHWARLGYWLAHRLSYTIFIGIIPDGLMVLHKCDKPPCVRPSCFFLGDAYDNAIDMISKGRGNYKVKYKFSDEIVSEIRSLRAMGIPTKVLSETFNISRRYVRYLIAYKNRN